MPQQPVTSYCVYVVVHENRGNLDSGDEIFSSDEFMFRPDEQAEAIAFAQKHSEQAMKHFTTLMNKQHKRRKAAMLAADDVANYIIKEEERQQAEESYYNWLEERDPS